MSACPAASLACLCMVYLRGPRQKLGASSYHNFDTNPTLVPVNEGSTAGAALVRGLMHLFIDGYALYNLNSLHVSMGVVLHPLTRRPALIMREETAARPLTDSHVHHRPIPLDVSQSHLKPHRGLGNSLVPPYTRGSVSLSPSHSIPRSSRVKGVKQ